MLNKSRFNRRLHRLESLLFNLFFQIGQYLKDIKGADSYVIVSIPVAEGKQWRGKQSSMRRYFYSVKVQVLTTGQGIPVEFGFVPGCERDVQALKKLPLSVAPESCIYGDAAYTDLARKMICWRLDGVHLKNQQEVQ